MKRAISCAEVGPLLHAHADGELPPPERAAVDGHLETCANCARESARMRGNLAYLGEVMARQRLAADFDSSFLFALPRKTARAVAAASARAAPRSVVIGGPRRKSRGGLYVVAGVIVAAGAAGAWWAFRPAPAVRVDGGVRSSVPEPGHRPPRTEGPADPRPVAPPPETPPKPRPGTGETTPAAPGVVRSAAELIAAVRAHRGGYLPVVGRGWSLLVEQPKEAAAVADAARAEKSAKLRAALVLCLGFDGSQDARGLVREFLADAAGEVRAAAAFGLARSLSFDSPQKRAIPTGEPLSMAVEVGPMEEGAALGELTGRLSTESDDGARRALVLVLSATAPSSAEVRARLLDGVKGAYGEELRDACLRGLRGVQDPAIVDALADALGHVQTPTALRPALVEAMIEADRVAAAEALARLAHAADDAAARRTLVDGVAKAGGATAETALQGFAQNDPDAAIRGAAVAALARFPSETTLGVLERIAEGDADQQVRVGAEAAAAHVRGMVEKAREAPPAEAGGGGE